MKRIIQIMMINLFFLSSLSIAQNQLRDNLFGDYDKLLDQLQNQNASVLSPENFEKALKYYKRASDDYQDTMSEENGASMSWIQGSKRIFKIDQRLEEE